MVEVKPREAEGHRSGQSGDQGRHAANLHFGIHASVVFQLGQDLITDEVQALVELVKNAYDADATSVSVTINTESNPVVTDSLDRRPEEVPAYPNARGFIRIDDNGEGMGLNTIKRGWLTISNSLKREMKRKGETTRNKHRVPLGDKGLGRLGAQRLGTNLEIFTRKKGNPVEYHVSLSWDEFVNADALARVPIGYATIENPRRKQGTTILISELQEEVWDKAALAHLRTGLAQMISPYEEVEDFRVTARIGGELLDLSEIARKVRSFAQIHYDLDFDGDTFSVVGKLQYDLFRPRDEMGKAVFAELVEKDAGERFFQFLMEKPTAKKLNLRRSTSSGWFLDYETKRKFDDIPGLKLESDKKGGTAKPANPGPFHGEVDSFDLDQAEQFSTIDSLDQAEQFSTLDSRSDYKAFIKEQSGIRVYRNGFGIRVDRDWLRLGGQWTNATSYYGLKPNNTLGYVALSAKHNARLEETTNREGFKTTIHYQNFYILLQEFVRFSLYTQGSLRRDYLKFVKANQEKIAYVKVGTTPEEVARELNQTLSLSQNHNQSIVTARARLHTAVNNIYQAAETAEAALVEDSPEREMLKLTSSEVQAALGEVTGILDGVENYLQNVAQARTKLDVITNNIGQLREQLSEVYEMVSLGLTAEVLSHEINNIAIQLADRNRDVVNYLRRQGINDSPIVLFTEYVDSMAAALRKQLSHLTPSLRYLRDRREHIPLTRFFDEVEDYYCARFEKEAIKTVVVPTNAPDFTLHMNKGKLLQIIDNLFLNSEYWLEEDIRRGRIEQGEIQVELDRPFVRISDNGRGIDPDVEGLLFEPFVTTKEQGKGRGLGLFIVRQLLDSEGCTITLLPERREGRLFRFSIDFTGSLSSAK